MSHVTSLARRYGFDALIVVAAVAAAAEVILNQGALPTAQTALWFAAPAAALLILPLLARRRFPFMAPITVWIGAAALSFVDGRIVVATAAEFAGGLAAAFLLGSLADAVQARIGLVVTVGAAVIIVYNNPIHAAGDFVFTPVLFAIAWLAGFALHERAAEAEAAEERALHAEREREAAARVAVAEERTRIARELHDIVAHAVSVMVLRVGAVRHRLPANLEDERDALRDVEQAGRTALTEMRRLLGAMREDGAEAELTPQPGLDDLDSLVEEIRRAGLPVALHVDGEAFQLPRSLDLSAYRILQEGLTNALKHAGASSADVTLRYGVEDLQLEVRDDGSGSPTEGGSEGGPGHGLAGIRERVKIYGGDMSAGAGVGGGFVLRTRLPVDGAQ